MCCLMGGRSFLRARWGRGRVGGRLPWWTDVRCDVMKGRQREELMEMETAQMLGRESLGVIKAPSKTRRWRRQDRMQRLAQSGG